MGATITKTVKIAVKIHAGTSYLRARKLAGPYRLLPNAIYDILVDKWMWSGRNENYNVAGAWSNELVVHPAKHQRFKRGFDIVDCQTGWILPASEIPEEAYGERNVALLLTPKKFETAKDGKLVVIPVKKRNEILHGFMQRSGMLGLINIASGIPVRLRQNQDSDCYPPADIRMLCRIDGEAIRPVVHMEEMCSDGRYHMVCLDFLPSAPLKAMTVIMITKRGNLMYDVQIGARTHRVALTDLLDLVDGKLPEVFVGADSNNLAMLTVAGAFLSCKYDEMMGEK